jgi:hypothetical protein
MKYVAVLTILSAAVMVSAKDMPTCAVPCIKEATAQVTTCDVTDLACMCQKMNSDKIRRKASECVVRECGLGKTLSTSLLLLTAFFYLVEMKADWLCVDEVLPATKSQCKNYKKDD